MRNFAMRSFQYTTRLSGEFLADRRDDASLVEPATFKLQRRVAMIDEMVRQAELQDCCLDAQSLQCFEHRAAGAAHDHVFLHRDQEVVAFSCLLYTSDAADERSSVDLGGR